MTFENKRQLLKKLPRCGCGSVGKAVASDSRDPWFGSRQWQNFIYQLFNRNDENKGKEATDGPSFKNEPKNVFENYFSVRHLKMKDSFKKNYHVFAIGEPSPPGDSIGPG